MYREPYSDPQDVTVKEVGMLLGVHLAFNSFTEME